MIELTWDGKSWKGGSEAPAEKGPWGIVDTVDGLWIGDDDGPKVHTEEIIARIAAELLDIQLGHQPGRHKHKPLPPGPWRKRDEVKTKMSTLEALKGKEEGRFL